VTRGRAVEILRTAGTLTSTLALSAACSALYGSDFDKYSPRNSSAGAGGRDASTSPTAGTGGLTSPGLTGGTAGTPNGGTTTGGAPMGGRSDSSGGSPSGGATGGTSPLDSGNTGGQSFPTGGTAGSGGVGGSTGGTQVDAGSGGTGGRDAGAGTGGRANPKPDGAAGASDSGDASGNGAGDAGPADPPLGTLWSNSPFFTGVLVCFTAAPHIEWNGELHCNAQAGPGQSCSGDPYAGTDLVTLGNAFLALIQET
jgi:hypothetical protein